MAWEDISLHCGALIWIWTDYGDGIFAPRERDFQINRKRWRPTVWLWGSADIPGMETGESPELERGGEGNREAPEQQTSGAALELLSLRWNPECC